MSNDALWALSTVGAFWVGFYVPPKPKDWQASHRLLVSLYAFYTVGVAVGVVAELFS